MTGRSWLGPALVLGLVLFLAPFSGCGTKDSSEANDLADTPGRRLFDDHCAICHGLDGTAKSGAEGSIDFSDSRFREEWSRERIVERILTGKGKMPSFDEKLREEEVDAIAGYLKSRPMWNAGP